MQRKERFWYRQPAQKWIEALPLGNGRIGAMVYGGTREEKIQIDESSFWSGAACAENNRPDSKELLETLRTLLLEEKFEEADIIAPDFVGNKNNYGTNMPVGNLVLTLDNTADKIEAYERSLCLADGIAATSFRMDGINFEREAFVSNPAQAAVVRMTADAAFSLCVRYDGIDNNAAIIGQEGSGYRISADARESLHSDGSSGVHLEGCLEVECDGSHRYEENCVYIGDSTSVVLYLDIETTMFQEAVLELALKRTRAAVKKGWEELKKEHIADAAHYYERVSLSLGSEELDSIPTDERIAGAAEGKADNGLMALMFQYGRYLLIASSREDSILPTHMGGIWNDNIYNKIDCTQDMHIDMNLQMQYWAAGQCSLPECYQPVLNYIENILMPSGEKTAKEVYGADGWMAHLVTNPWGFTSLGWSYNWGVWSLGGVWCATLGWDYYTYTKDIKWLAEHGYPMIEGAARFAADYVFYDEKKDFYRTGPSYSPENMFRMGGRDYFLSLSNTCDIILVREILVILQKASAILEVGDNLLLEKAEKILAKLPPFQIGKRGQLQEWFYDFEEPIPNHRHTSHLLGLYPFRQIVPQQDPALTEAAKKTIEMRYENFEITSWGMNMLLGYYARMGDGESALTIIQDTFRRLVKPNMASVMSDETSMWCGTWELDGNTGFTAAMAELLVQSEEGKLRILPALPAQWDKGELRGISIQGGHRINIFWENGKWKRIVLFPACQDSLLLLAGDRKEKISLKEGQQLVIEEAELK